jgi:pimeloyl-ACP methyl ester carboxylesterase
MKERTSKTAGARDAARAARRRRNGVLHLAIVLAAVVAGLHARQSGLPPPPGQLIDIGGRKLHVICTGQGTPPVVLEAGASSFAIDFTLVQREVSRTNRVCAYDRAGMGWSEPAGDDESTDADLHKLLTVMKEPPPYVLVGASRGGLMVRTFVLDYPEEVAGLVLVDPSSEDRLFTMVDGEMIAIARATPSQIRKSAPREPVRVSRRTPQTGAPFDRLPPDLYRMRIRLDERLIASLPDTVPAEVVAASQQRERAYLARLLESRTALIRPLGSRPTVVLSRGTDPDPNREAVQAALAALSTNSRLTIVAGAGHEIHLFEPAAVVQAVADVVTAVRTRTPLPRR